MQDFANRRNWRKLYEAALIEHDPAKLRPLIVEAHNAIQEEIRRLWYARSLHWNERQSLDAASRYLEMLDLSLDRDEVRRVA